MAFLLGIETSGNLCSVALFRDGELIDDKEIQEESAHSKKITLLIERILIQNQLNKKDLNAMTRNRINHEDFPDTIYIVCKIGNIISKL